MIRQLLRRVAWQSADGTRPRLPLRGSPTSVPHVAKIVSLTDAVAEFVHDGDTVALEGFTHLIPFAAGHEIIRQRRRDLTLARMTPDLSTTRSSAPAAPES